jgi:hypothetical protein
VTDSSGGEKFSADTSINTQGSWQLIYFSFVSFTRPLECLSYATCDVASDGRENERKGDDIKIPVPVDSEVQPESFLYRHLGNYVTGGGGGRNKRVISLIPFDLCLSRGRDVGESERGVGERSQYILS